MFSYRPLAVLLSLLISCSVSLARQDATVYVTKTGSKYHNAGCSYLSRSSIAMKLSEIGSRYSPCSRCNPPSLSSLKTNRAPDPKKVETTNPQNARSSKETEIGTTPTGKTLYQGPRGGVYHYSKSGKKVYHKRK